MMGRRKRARRRKGLDLRTTRASRRETGHRAGLSLPAELDRVQVAARRSRHTRFTALLHHVDEAALMRAYQRQRRAASAGVDGMTVERYERDLERNIRDLCDRVHSGRYRPQPVRRTYIPKADGGRRPLGVPALEDKIAQGAVAEVLSAIYETDFLGFSYGFRPRRSAHHALQALHTALMTRKALWVAKQHEWLSAVLRGHFAYYGLPSNMRSMVGFAYEVRRLWLRAVGPAQSARHDMGPVQPLDEVFPLPMPTATHSTSAKSALATG